jgi:hypothetical protein
MQEKLGKLLDSIKEFENQTSVLNKIISIAQSVIAESKNNSKEYSNLINDYFELCKQNYLYKDYNRSATFLLRSIKKQEVLEKEDLKNFYKKVLNYYINYNTDSSSEDESDDEKIQNFKKYDEHFLGKYLMFALCKELKSYYLQPKESPEYNIACQQISFRDFLFEEYSNLDLNKFSSVLVSGNVPHMDEFGLEN